MDHPCDTGMAQRIMKLPEVGQNHGRTTNTRRSIGWYIIRTRPINNVKTKTGKLKPPPLNLFILYLARMINIKHETNNLLVSDNFKVFPTQIVHPVPHSFHNSMGLFLNRGYPIFVYLDFWKRKLHGIHFGSRWLRWQSQKHQFPR